MPHDHLGHSECNSGSAHVLFHQKHRRGRLDIEAARIEGDAFSNQSDLRRVGLAAGLLPIEFDQSRRPGAGPADGVDQGKVLSDEIVADHAAHAGPIVRSDLSNRRFDFGRSQIACRGVDQIAPQPDRRGNSLQISSIDVRRQCKTGDLISTVGRRRLVPSKAVGPERPRQGGEGRVAKAFAQPVVASGKGSGDVAEQQFGRAARLAGVAVSGAEKNGGQVPIRRRQQDMTFGSCLEAYCLDPAPADRATRRPRALSGANEMDRNGAGIAGREDIRGFVDGNRGRWVVGRCHGGVSR